MSTAIHANNLNALIFEESPTNNWHAEAFSEQL